jgi:MFS family permease
MRTMLAPLRHPRFRRVWLGQFMNSIGDAAFLVAVALLLARGTNPATSLSLGMAVISSGSIFSVLLGGVLADRMKRSHVIIASDLVRASGTVLVLTSDSGDRLLVMLAGATLVGLGSGIYLPAYQALFPTLVPADGLAAANSLRTISSRAASIVGAAGTGLAVALTSPAVVLFLNIGTYLVSVTTLIRLRDTAPTRAEKQTGARALLRDARDGFTYVAKRPWILAVMLDGTVQIAFLTAPLGVLLPLALGGGGALGWVVTAQAVGAIVGAWLGSRRIYRRQGAVAIGAACLEVALMVAIAASAPLPIVLAAAFVAGVGLSIFAVIWVTTLQKTVPDQMRGRVFSLDFLTAVGFAPVGSLVAGAGVNLVGLHATSWACAGVLSIAVVAVLFVPGVAAFADPTPRAAPDGHPVTGRGPDPSR